MLIWKMNTINYCCPCNIYFSLAYLCFHIEKKISKNFIVSDLLKKNSSWSVNKTLKLLSRIHHPIILARQRHPNENEVALVLIFTVLQRHLEKWLENQGQLLKI